MALLLLNSLNIIRNAENKLNAIFQQMEETAYSNQCKVLKAFQDCKVREYHFSPSSGYGYGDDGRTVLEELYSHIFSAEDSLVRSQIASGTHAISACLFGILNPGDELVSLTGRPYDTLASIITTSRASLCNKGINYYEAALDKNGKPCFDTIKKMISPRTKMVLIQRSRGYSLRPALSIDEIKDLCQLVKQINPGTIVFVDNCYGEFVQQYEPLQVGADIIAGSLIKNPGGGLAPSGGYICGKKDLVEQISWHLTAPGLGKEVGASLVNKRWFFQGLFVAPHVVLQSLKGAVLLAYILEQYGYSVYPRWDDSRSDIVQAVQFHNPEEVSLFCQLIQGTSPVDSDVKLEFADLPGYKDKIIMAAGTFVQGSSIELSCDAPLRQPYCAYLQGGLTYEHLRYVVARVLDIMLLNKK